MSPIQHPQDRRSAFDRDMTVGFDFREVSSLCALSDGELLEVCNEVLDTVSVKDAAKKLQTISDEVVSHLRDLRQRIERESAKIPIPTRIFVDQQERLLAYRTVCELLVFTEPIWQALREGWVRLSVLEGDLVSSREAQGRLTVLLEAAKQRKGIDRATVRSMKQRAQRRAAQADALFRDFLKEREVLQYLCGRIEADFLTRMSKIADFEHEGAACEPSGCVRLCAELCLVISSTETKMT